MPKPLTQNDLPAAATQAVVSQRLRARQAAGKHVLAPIAVHLPQPGQDQQTDLLERLSREVRQLESSSRGEVQSATISSGCEALDAKLPGGGYLPGSVIEYLRMTPACGASYLAFAAAAAAMRATEGFLVIVDTLHNIYPPALVSHGIQLGKVIFVRPQSQADAIWAVDQALRTPAVGAVVAELERVDDRAARRWQLAAEKGHGLAFLLRSAAARKQPSWAEVQWLVGSRPQSPRHDRRAAGAAPLTEDCRAAGAAPLTENRRAAGAAPLTDAATAWHRVGNRHLQVQLARVRGGQAGAIVRLEIDSISGKLLSTPTAPRARNHHEPSIAVRQPLPSAAAEAGAVHLASELAHPKSPSRRAAAG